MFSAPAPILRVTSDSVTLRMPLVIFWNLPVLLMLESIESWTTLPKKVIRNTPREASYGVRNIAPESNPERIGPVATFRPRSNHVMRRVKFRVF